MRALHQAWFRRLPVVVRLAVDPARLRSPSSWVVEPWAVGMGFEPWLDRLALPGMGPQLRRPGGRRGAQHRGLAEVPFGQFDQVLLTKDTIAIEPDVLEYKLYAPGVGPVLILGVSGGGGREDLVSGGS